MTSKKEIEQLLIEFFTPRLSKYHFKWLKSKGIYKRNCGDVQQEVSFYLNNYHPQEVHLKIELGSNALAKFLKTKSNTFDTFSPSRIPNWDYKTSTFGVYYIDGSKECEALHQLSHEFIHSGIPFLDKMTTVEELLKFYLTPTEIFTRRRLVIQLCLLLNSKEWAHNVLKTWDEFKVSRYAQMNFNTLDKVDDEMHQSLSVLL